MRYRTSNRTGRRLPSARSPAWQRSDDATARFKSTGRLIEQHLRTAAELIAASQARTPAGMGSLDGESSDGGVSSPKSTDKLHKNSCLHHPWVSGSLTSYPYSFVQPAI